MESVTGDPTEGSSAELPQQGDAAREAEAARDEFFTLVAHELRTPLTSIVGYVELLTEDVEGVSELSPEERARFLQIINRNSRRMLRLVGDLLFIARLEAGRVDLERVRFDPAQPVGDSVEAAEPRAAHARVSLGSEVETGIEIEGDEERLGQVVDNLISNAIKFTPEGGDVNVRLRRNGTSAVIEVSDTGVGIPPEELEKVFSRFFRSSAGAEVEGVGLGLTIARSLAECLGGGIEVDSAVGRGSTFRLRLPLAP